MSSGFIKIDESIMVFLSYSYFSYSVKSLSSKLLASGIGTKYYNLYLF